MRRHAKPAKAKVEAKLPVPRKSRKHEGSKVRDLETRLAEAQEQQAATAEILRVISSSPTDPQPVFDMIAESVVRLCDGVMSGVYRFDGSLIHFVAHHNWTDAGLATARRVYPKAPDRDTQVATAILDRAVLEVRDFENDPKIPAGSLALARALGYRSDLVVPMLLQGNPIGAIAVARAEAGPFSVQQLALLKTFADQAVIAIENVRLFNETKEALERQTATSEILQVIATSPTDVQPVLDALVESVGRLCEAADTFLLLVEGDQLKVAALHPSVEGGVISNPIQRGWVAGRAVMELRTVHVEDLANAQSEFPLGWEIAVRLGHRTALAMPLLRKGVPIGALFLRRRAVRQFSDKEIALLKTFADQAVIAIENVRLFKELQTRNQELTVALAQQTATSEVLAVISGAQTDAQPVFKAIVQSARRLCDASYSSVYRVDGQLVHLVAHNHQTPEAAEAIRGAWPMPLTGDSFVVRAIRKNAVIHTDMQEDPTASATLVARGKALGHRRIVVVPMVREGQPIGAIRVSRGEATPFTEQHIALLQTFADQAVIAIENVRLFTELQASNREIVDKSRQLEVASQHKSEFLANMSHELRTPLNAIIGFSEVLSERMFGELNEKQEEYLKDIHASGSHLLSLINDILDLSKIEAGRMELEVTDFDLPTALDNALTLIRERAGRRGIDLHMSVDNRLGQLQADERKVRQVVLNLLSNAIKFTPEGGRIEVRARPVDAAVEVSVSDTGVGIAPEDQEAVFEEFRQVGTADKKVEGTGLGLSLSRKFIELHGGKIWVTSQVGVGSTFTFTLPVGRSQ